MVLHNNDASKQRRVTYKFVTDNPYRLLSLPSSTSSRVLRQKASAAEQAAQVGLPVEVSLENTFGSDELSSCSDLVRALSADPVTCMLHRQMWPYQLQTQPETKPTPFAILPSEATALPDFHTRQWTFLSHWFDFVLNDYPPSLVQALNYFTYLYEDVEHQDYLEQMLKEEGNGDEVAQNTVIDAQNRLAVFLARESCSRALEMLTKQNLVQFRTVFSTIQNFPLKTEMIECTVMETFNIFGNRERERVDQDYQRTATALSQTGWSPLWAAFDLSGIRMLRELGSAVGQGYSNAHIWQESADRYADLIGGAMRQYSITVANESEDYKTATSVLHQIRELPVSPLLSEKITSDLKDIATLVDARQQADSESILSESKNNHQATRQFDSGSPESVDDFLNALPSSDGYQASQQTQKSVGQKAQKNKTVSTKPVAPAPFFVQFVEFDTPSGRIKPVTSPPLLFTLNGCGLRLYGRSRYVDNPQWHYTTLFITLLFLPIIPLSHYLVSDAPQGRINFHGKVPFALWHKAHLTVGLIVVFWFASLLSQPPNPSANVSAAVPTAHLSDIPEGTPALRNPYSEASTKALAKDVNTMAAWLEKSRVTIDIDRRKLVEENADISACEDKIALNRQTLNYYNPGAVAIFNKSVDEVKPKLRDYNRKVEKLNAEVNHYNHILRRARSEQQQITEIANDVNRTQ